MSCSRRIFVRAALSCAILLGGGPSEAIAQCRAVEAQPGDAGYRDRGNRCEGLYVGRQSSPVNLQVISLVKGRLSLPGTMDVLEIRVPDALARVDSLRQAVTLVGEAREANLYWALDSTDPLLPGDAFTWNLEQLREIGLDGHRIGLFGTTVHKTGLGGPVFVTLAVTPPGKLSERDTVELVFRIPAAAAACLTDIAGTGCQRTASPLNADGYFRIEIPAGELTGLTTLAFLWRPGGSPTWSRTPERLTILGW